MTKRGTARLHATVYPRTRVKRAESEREQEAARSSTCSREAGVSGEKPSNRALGAEGRPQAVRGFSAPYQLIGGAFSDPREAAAPELESALSRTLITG